MKIDTVIFDIGNVLAPFNWRAVYEEIFEEAQWEPISDATVRQTDLWDELDKGVLSFDDLLDLFIRRAPHLEAEIRRGISEVYERIQPFPYAEAWVKELKERGYKVYLLSNYGKVPYEKSLPRFTFARHTHGGVISYEVQKTKPDPAIYQFLQEKYRLVPQASVFLDDNKANIEAARALGFHTILFENKEQADRELAKYLRV